MQRNLRKLRKSEAGVTAIEYALIGSLIAVVIVQGELMMNEFSMTFDHLDFSARGFDLGGDNALATATPQAIGAALFSTNTDGTYCLESRYRQVIPKIACMLSMPPCD
jgi:Flp pilus assembly pilin Flp